MDYCKIYDDLISRSFIRELPTLIEKHHIIPKCIGGSNSKNNIAKLTPEEHYLAHQLLVKIYPDNYRLVFAAHRMTNGIHRNNKLYGWIRRQHSLAMKEYIKENGSPNKGNKLTQAQKDHLSRINTGKVLGPMKEETKIKRSAVIQNKKENGWIKPPVSAETRNKLSNAAKGRIMPERTKEHRDNLSKSNKGKTSHKKGISVHKSKSLVSVTTPLGNFISCAEAGRVHNIKKGIVWYRCNSITEKWKSWQFNID